MDREQTSDNGGQAVIGNEQLTDNDGTQEVKRRPNANYNLSHPDKPDMPASQEGIVFHYSRDRRLAKAPQAVKDLYNDNKPFRFNLFRPLVADRPRAVLFGSIIILCAIILFFSNAGFFDNSHVLDGNRIEISGIRYEGAAIIVLKKNIRTGITSINTVPYSGVVDIAVSPSAGADGEYSVFYHRIFFTLEKTEEYRFAVPFDSPDLLIVLQSEKSNLQFKIITD